LEEARRFVEQHDLQGMLRLRPTTTAIEDCYRQADAVGLFSLYEGLPNTVCEGMACGKPIVTSRVSDADSLVTAGENGFLCDPESPASIADALLQLRRLPPAERPRMGEASRRRAEALFAPQIVVERYERLLAAAARREPPAQDICWPPEVPDSARQSVARWHSGA
jgi:glycosyltransferase involved in cell wall biosynthesis